jgi:uncharacterized membrane protein YGL010W
MSSSDPLHAPVSDQRREIDRWLGNYSQDHRHPSNIALHHVCVPLIVWSVMAALWAIPVPAGLGQQGLWAALAIVGASAWYLRLSRALGVAMLGVFVALAVVTQLLWLAVGSRAVLWIAIVVFVLAWIGQFVGHRIEGKRPSFFTDLAYLLVGPLWIVAKTMRRAGIAY